MTAGDLVYSSTAAIWSIDGLLPGEAFRLRVRRGGDDGGDTMLGDAQLVKVIISQ